MATIIVSATGGASNTNGAYQGGAQPTAADDLVLNAASGNFTIPSGTTLLCRSLDCSGLGVSNYAGVFTFAATTSFLSVGDAGGGNVTFVATMTLTLTGIGTINFLASTANTTYQLTTAGLTMPGLQVSVGPTTTLQLADNCTSAGGVNHTAGGIAWNSKIHSWTTFASTTATVRNLMMGSSAVTLTAGGTAWNTATTTNLTVMANTATVTLSGSGAAFSPGPLNLNGLSVVMSGSGNASVASGPSTVAAFTRTGTAVKTDILLLAANFTVTGAATFNSQSSVNRLLVQSSAVGTARTITAGSLVCTNVVDFMDITGAGAATWTTAASGATYFGDAQGNSGITFTTPATQTHTASAGGSWSDVTKWTSRVPLPQDNVIVDGTTTGVLTQDMPRFGANLTMTGFAGTWTFMISSTMYGNLVMGSGMASSNVSCTFAGRGNQTITSNGFQWANTQTFSAPGGTYTLQDAMTCITSVSNFFVSFGTFTSNNFALNGFGTFTATGTSTVNLGTSTVTLTTTTNVAPWTVASTVTFNGASSTIVFVGVAGITRTFSGGGKIYGTVTYTVAGSQGALNITFANTINVLNIGPGRVVTWPSSTVNTVNNFNATGVPVSYLSLPGVASQYASTPSAVVLNLTGSMTIDVKASLSSWTAPAVTGPLVSKLSVVTAGYELQIQTSGKLVFVWSNGTSAVQVTSTAALTLSAGQVSWVRASFVANNGSSQNTCTFYTSVDGVSWTILGSTVTTAGVATVSSDSSILVIGQRSPGNNLPVAGSYYEVRIYNSALGSGSGTPVFDANFTTKAWGSDSLTESSTNAATVSIVGATAQAGDGRVLINSSTPGTPATFLCNRGPTRIDYATIQDIAAVGAPFYAYESVLKTGCSGVSVLDTHPAMAFTGSQPFMR